MGTASKGASRGRRWCWRSRRGSRALRHRSRSARPRRSIRALRGSGSRIRPPLASRPRRWTRSIPTWRRSIPPPSWPWSGGACCSSTAPSTRSAISPRCGRASSPCCTATTWRTARSISGSPSKTSAWTTCRACSRSRSAARVLDLVTAPLGGLSPGFERGRQPRGRTAARFAGTGHLLPVQQLGLQRGRSSLRAAHRPEPLRRPRDRPCAAAGVRGLGPLDPPQVGRRDALPEPRLPHGPLHA